MSKPTDGNLFVSDYTIWLLYKESELIYDMIFITYNCVSTQWQLSVNLYKNRNETDIYRRRNNTKNNTKTKNTQNRKHTYKTRKET